jgi:hypothetical protein
MPAVKARPGIRILFGSAIAIGYGEADLLQAMGQ